jgi:predicted PolB exonuclease-like 3'-5' exonuclease
LLQENLQEYVKRYPGLKMVDLSQTAARGRGRGNTSDGQLCTLTRNSGKLYLKDIEHKANHAIAI